MTARSLQRLIHLGCRDLGMSQEARHDMQLLVTGKASMTDMTEADLNKVVLALKAKGMKVDTKKGRPASKRADVRFLHVMWKLLGEAGALKVPGRAGLNSFIRSRFEAKWGAVPLDVDALFDASQINDVTRALKDWCKRAGVTIR